uniref:Uncharacterized protein n=1 Tax=Arundo donax TaxID=35708 RepID=A0A0A9GKF9_ARUDO
MLINCPDCRIQFIILLLQKIASVVWLSSFE